MKHTLGCIRATAASLLLGSSLIAADVREVEISSPETLVQDFVFLGRETGSKRADPSGIQMEFPESFGTDAFLYVWGRNVCFVGKQPATGLPANCFLDFAVITMEGGQFGRAGVAVLLDGGKKVFQAGVVVERKNQGTELASLLSAEFRDAKTFELRQQEPRLLTAPLPASAMEWYRLTVDFSQADAGTINLKLVRLGDRLGGTQEAVDEMTATVDPAEFSRARVDPGFFADVSPMARMALGRFAVKTKQNTP